MYKYNIKYASIWNMKVFCNSKILDDESGAKLENWFEYNLDLDLSSTDSYVFDIFLALKCEYRDYLHCKMKVI